MNKKNIVFHIRSLDQAIIRTMMKGKDIKKSPSPTQVRIVLFLIEHKNEVISQKDIENHLKLSRATVSDVLTTMEKNGYIKKVARSEDARSNNIVLNDIALEIHKKAEEEMEKINNLLQQNISKEDLDNFIKVIYLMNENLDSTTNL